MQMRPPLKQHQKVSKQANKGSLLGLNSKIKVQSDQLERKQTFQRKIHNGITILSSILPSRVRISDFKLYMRGTDGRVQSLRQELTHQITKWLFRPKLPYGLIIIQCSEGAHKKMSTPNACVIMCSIATCLQMTLEGPFSPLGM